MIFIVIKVKEATSEKETLLLPPPLTHTTKLVIW